MRKHDLAEPQGGDDEERMQAIASLSIGYSVMLALLVTVVIAAAVLIILLLAGM